MKFVSIKKIIFAKDENENSSVDKIFYFNPKNKIIKSEDILVYRSSSEIIELAKKEADRIIDNAKKIYVAEKNRGYKEGISAAKKEQAEHMIEQISRSLDYYESVERRMIDLVVYSIRKIVLDLSSEEKVVTVVKSAISAVRNQSYIKIKVNPAQLNSMTESMDLIYSSFPGINYMDLSCDQKIEEDSCSVESEIGIIEASINDQLQSISNALEKVLGKKDK